MKKKTKKKKKVSSPAVKLLKFTMFVLLVLVATYFMVNYGFRRTVVHNVSMQETLYDGDNIIMDEFTYFVSDPKRFDVICFKNYEEKELIIKRIIGLPGETVRISDGEIFINEKKIRDKAGLGDIEEAGRASFGVTLSEDEYFVLGDNREKSIDSRYGSIGNVKKQDILGKAVLVIWPINRIKIIN